MTQLLSRVLIRRALIAVVMLTSIALGAVLHSPVAAHAGGGPLIWTSTYYPPSPVCMDGICMSSDDGVGSIQVNGLGFTNGGHVFVGIYSLKDKSLYWSANLTASLFFGFTGLDTGRPDCSFDTSMSYNYFVRAYDYYTGTWSNVVNLKICTRPLL